MRLHTPSNDELDNTDNPASSNGYSKPPDLASPSYAGPSLAGPSTLVSTSTIGEAPTSTTNGYSSVRATNGFTQPSALPNGTSTAGTSTSLISTTSGNLGIARVPPPPWKTLYKTSSVDREEFVRLVVQALQDVGYTGSAATLEAESGYSLEAPGVRDFRSAVVAGQWEVADRLLHSLGVATEQDLRAAKFLISQQKYLELLEARQISAALQILRNELAPLDMDLDRLHLLSSLMMCSSAQDLLQRAQWDGASGNSRQQLLADLHRYIPSSIMIPERRLDTLLENARAYHRQRCLYHNSREPFSLLADHLCTRSQFPIVTTHILAEHEDEVWHMQWSNDGRCLASASKDKTVIIWRIGPETEPTVRECTRERVLRDHTFDVGCIAWSPDDRILLTTSHTIIRMWDMTTGVCTRELPAHKQTIGAITWLPDGSGFVSASMDRRIIVWDADGKERDSWGVVSIRVTDFALAPDLSRLVAIGLPEHRGLNSLPPSTSSLHAQAQAHAAQQHQQTQTQQQAHTPQPLLHAHEAIHLSPQQDRKIIIYDWATKQEQASLTISGELTSVKVSQDSKFALISHAPDEILLCELETARIFRRYHGQRQDRHIIRSCFGGVEENFILSGSEDGNIYVWHRQSGALLEVLGGHGEGSVNSVAWNPRESNMFASCSDDCTIRIWQPEIQETELSLNGSSLSRGAIVAVGDGRNGAGSGGGKL